jgi:hypothetical protein
MSQDNYYKYKVFLKRIFHKLKPRFSFHYISYTTLFVFVIFSFIHLASGATPNPGHPWDEIGDGVFIFTNGATDPLFPKTYTFPNANATVWTTGSTIAKGSVLVSNAVDTIGAETWNSLGTKILTNTSGTISWEFPASGMVWPAGGAGIPNYSGSSSWGTSYTTTGSGTVLALATTPTFTTNITTPLILGGTTTTSPLTLRSTSGVGTTGADIIFETGNNGDVEAMKILNNGNIGIGTSNPSQKLVVKGGGFSVFDDIAEGISFTSDSIQWTNVNADKIFEFTYPTQDVFTFYNDGTEVAVFRDGRVGIGQTTPTARLHLKAGTATANTAPFKFTSGTNLTTPEAGAMEWDGTNLFITQTSGPTRKTLAYTTDITSGLSAYLPLAGGTMTGNITFSGAQKIIGGTSTTSDLTFQTTSGVGTTGADMHFLVGNNGATEAMTILNNGNVGIGMNDPTFPLDIAGYMRAYWGIFGDSSGSNRVVVGFDHLGNEVGMSWLDNDDLIAGVNASKTAYKFGGYDDTAGIAVNTTTGNVGIGIVSPTARLQLPAGTATASTAPLKFTSGTNLTVAEAGAMEWDGTNLFITQTSGPTRKTLAYTTDITPSNWDTIGDPTGNGAIAMGSTVQTMDWGTATTQNALSLTGGALTTGKLLSLSSNTLTSGTLLDITSAGTGALTNQKGINVALSGTNATSGQTTYGAYISNTHAGTTSTNVGLYASATGGTTANYAALLNGDLSFTTGASRTISVLDGTSDNLTIKSGDNAVGNSGNLYLLTGSAIGNPGQIYITAGSSTGALNNGGNVYIRGGSGSMQGNVYLSNSGGSVYIGSSNQFQVNSTGAIVASTGYTQGSGTMSLTSANTTQTTTSSAFRGNFNSLTTGTGMYIASSSLTSGRLLDLVSTGTGGLTNQRGLNIALSGTNASSGQTTYGAYISNTHAGTTSTNVGLYATATGGTTANYAAHIDGTLRLTDVNISRIGSNSVSIGGGTPNVADSFYVGANSGSSATGAFSSNFIGNSAGSGATDASNSNFLGNSAGHSATVAFGSNFFGPSAGHSATFASFSNFFGNQAGYSATNASYSNLFGFQAGKSFSGNNIGTNNIIIGKNISLPDGAFHSINIGGVLFGKNTYFTATGNPSIAPTATGSIGIGVVSPTARLMLPAGTATAETAPLKFTSGTNLTVAEAGAMEWDGTNLFITQTSGPTRKTLAYTTDITPSNWDTIGDPSGNGAIAFGSTVQTMDWGTATTQNALTMTGGALTTGKLLSLSSNTLTSGTLLDITSAGTGALTNQKGINVALSGTNATSGQTTYGAYISNTHAGTTSTNVGLYASATGGTTANYAAIFENGNVGIGINNPTKALDVAGSLNIGNTGGTTYSLVGPTPITGTWSDDIEGLVAVKQPQHKMLYR